ncbi:hypothetical protein XENTR_v10006606 [Xenopus tropicalis]|nr:hypothetical protein XENTR_v10006606 [Xenopus tropicalis]
MQYRVTAAESGYMTERMAECRPRPHPETAAIPQRYESGVTASEPLANKGLVEHFSFLLANLGPSNRECHIAVSA